MSLNNIKPMLLKEVSSIPTTNNYLYELKYDGIRAIITIENNKLKITTRNLNDVTNLYPELLSIKDNIKAKKVIFDGEIVAFKNNLPSFQELQKRVHLKDKDKINEIKDIIPVIFVAFDLLYEDKSLIDLPLIKRKEILNKYPNTCVFYKSITYKSGISLFKKIKKIGLEGIVAKDIDSIYLPGKRVDYWLKIKNFRVESFYIGGYIIGKAKVSLLLGEYVNDKFIYVGKVGVIPKYDIVSFVLKETHSKNYFTNFNNKAIYIKPIYKIEVKYMERTNNNT